MTQRKNATRLLGWLVGGSVLVYGCGGSGSGAAPKPPVPPAVSVNALMVAMVDHNGHVLWDAEKEGKAPKNDSDWQEIEHAAIQLAGSGTLIALGGTGPADAGWANLPDWKKYSQTLTDAAVVARAAAQAKNFEALVKANGQLVDSCEQCHKAFKPNLPTEGILHPHQK